MTVKDTIMNIIEFADLLKQAADAVQSLAAIKADIEIHRSQEISLRHDLDDLDAQVAVARDQLAAERQAIDLQRVEAQRDREAAAAAAATAASQALAQAKAAADAAISEARTAADEIRTQAHQERVAHDQQREAIAAAHRALEAKAAAQAKAQADAEAELLAITSRIQAAKDAAKAMLSG